MSGPRYFSGKTFEFLEDLKANNDRDWFAANKMQYEEHLKAPALRLIEDFGALLDSLSPHFTATPRSLFRIHRDTRFSKDKSPYKTAAGIHFRHQHGGDVHTPGYYLHIEPGSVFAGLGIWHPDAASLRAIRELIVDAPERWSEVSRDGRFSGAFELEGDRLKRPPRGFDPEHPLAEDLKWKDFIAVRRLPQSFVTSRDLPTKLVDLYRPGGDFMRFLCDAVGVPF